MLHYLGYPQDFKSVDDAAALMETSARNNFWLGGKLLLFDYSHSSPASALAAGGGAGPMDWVCDMCQAVNFARYVRMFDQRKSTAVGQCCLSAGMCRILLTACIDMRHALTLNICHLECLHAVVAS